MPTPITAAAAATRAQLAPTDEAVIAFAVTSREPDRDVPRDELAWWLAQQERAEIRAALAARGLLRGTPRPAARTPPAGDDTGATPIANDPVKETSMLDTIPAAPALARVATRWRVERDEYGPLGACAGGLFTTPVVPGALLAKSDELGRRVGAWVPDGCLL